MAHISKHGAPIAIDQWPPDEAHEAPVSWMSGNKGFQSIGIPWGNQYTKGRFRVKLSPDTPGGFVVIGHCDLDGDGKPAVFRATLSEEAYVVDDSRF